MSEIGEGDNTPSHSNLGPKTDQRFEAIAQDFATKAASPADTKPSIGPKNLVTSPSNSETQTIPAPSPEANRFTLAVNYLTPKEEELAQQVTTLETQIDEINQKNSRRTGLFGRIANSFNSTKGLDSKLEEIRSQQQAVRQSLQDLPNGNTENAQKIIVEDIKKAIGRTSGYLNFTRIHDSDSASREGRRRSIEVLREETREAFNALRQMNSSSVPTLEETIYKLERSNARWDGPEISPE